MQQFASTSLINYGTNEAPPVALLALGKKNLDALLGLHTGVQKLRSLVWCALSSNIRCLKQIRILSWLPLIFQMTTIWTRHWQKSSGRRISLLSPIITIRHYGSFITYALMCEFELIVFLQIYNIFRKDCGTLGNSKNTHCMY